MVPDQIKNDLIEKAIRAQEHSYSPYSKFSVGAAIFTEDGQVFTGCNVENVSYGLANCAERTAAFKMISEAGPQSRIKYIAVTTKADIPCSPCGACRQVLQELGPNCRIIYKGENGFKDVSMEQLLPGAFSEFTTD